MRIFLAGATGAIGSRLVPLLVDAGHDVTAMARTADAAASLLAAGTRPVLADGLDRDAVAEAVLAADPEVVIHQMTALKGLGSLRRFDDDFALTNRLRTEGTDHLLAAAQAAGARRFIAQSYAGWPVAREGGAVKDERAPFDAHPPKAQRRTLAAIRRLERTVTGADGIEGVVLRYGALYGPGTSLAPGGEQVDLLRRRRWPVIGSGDGVWSFCHVDDAAAATVRVLDRGGPGVFNVVDDEPAPVREWLPALAEAIGAPAPRHAPTWVGRLVAGEVAVSMMTSVRGASNARARGELGWRPAWPSWRRGFTEALAGA